MSGALATINSEYALNLQASDIIDAVAPIMERPVQLPLAEGEAESIDDDPDAGERARIGTEPGVAGRSDPLVRYLACSGAHGAA